MKGEVLVAIVNCGNDMEIAREQHWYRIPVEQVEKLKRRNCWFPKWLAFYQTKAFAREEAHTVTYYARVKGIREVYRWELFPDQPRDDNSQKRDCKLEIATLQKLARPIVSNRLRRITFIPTTLKKLKAAKEINDLWDESPLEDRLWQELKRLESGQNARSG
ncbi:MAG: hypothetical protein K6T90_20020 [Leptolyngbyaceae cyanobacterium HOT.MB2.61]|nr:hypothetical protein [Leptolyngbyaceae cyanobacterium HOT.MB2.61]